MSDKLDVVKTWFRRVWAEEDESAIDDMLVPDTNARGLDAKSRVGPDAFKQFHRNFLNKLSNIDIQIMQFMEDGDWVAVLITINAKKRNTDQDISITGSVFVKIVDGKLVEGYNHLDFIGLLEQLEYFPENTLMIGLTA